MKLTSLLQTRAVLSAVLLLASLALAGCAGSDEPSQPGETAGSATPAAVVPVAPPDMPPRTAVPPTDALVDEPGMVAEPGIVADEPTPADDGAPASDARPAPPAPVRIGNSTSNASCDTDADCEIKDVGSCCGYNPRCLNKAAQTFPEQVKAQCAKGGRVGICGFPSLSGCQCVSGQCAGMQESSEGGLVQ